MSSHVPVSVLLFVCRSEADTAAVALSYQLADWLHTFRRDRAAFFPPARGTSAAQAAAAAHARTSYDSASVFAEVKWRELARLIPHVPAQQASGSQWLGRPRFHPVRTYLAADLLALVVQSLSDEPSRELAHRLPSDDTERQSALLL